MISILDRLFLTFLLLVVLEVITLATLCGCALVCEYDNGGGCVNRPGEGPRVVGDGKGQVWPGLRPRLQWSVGPWRDPLLGRSHQWVWILRLQQLFVTCLTSCCAPTTHYLICLLIRTLFTCFLHYILSWSSFRCLLAHFLLLLTSLFCYIFRFGKIAALIYDLVQIFTSCCRLYLCW